PDIAGTGRADPRAAVISAAMMLEFLGEAGAAAAVRGAVDKSDDVTGTTAEIGDAIARCVVTSWPGLERAVEERAVRGRREPPDSERRRYRCPSRRPRRSGWTASSSTGT